MHIDEENDLDPLVGLNGLLLECAGHGIHLLLLDLLIIASWNSNLATDILPQPDYKTQHCEQIKPLWHTLAPYIQQRYPYCNNMQASIILL